MSQKHGQIGAQWTKSAPIAGTAPQKLSSYEAATSSSAAAATTTGTGATSPYGTCSIPGLHTQATPADIPYMLGRFQAPPLHATMPLTIAANTPQSTQPQSQVSPTVLAISTPTSTNVPAPSGFAAPTFPTANATSVLTPNPFAAAAAAGVGNNASLAFANAFGLNTAQQLELGKIMNAMNAAGGNSPVPPSVVIPPTTPGQQIAQLSPAMQGQRHHNDNASGSNTISAVGTAAPHSGGVINSTIAENVMTALNTVPSPIPKDERVGGSGTSSSVEKLQRVQRVIEDSLDEKAKLQIAQILDHVATLKPIEKLFLYLRLPGETADADPLRQPQNPLGTRSEINHTINWVRSHLEHDPQVSIPKQDVYNDYIEYCDRLNIKPLSTADFGKVMKQVFPGVRPRRLGTRGNSRYCYAAMRKTTKLTPPQLPQLAKIEPGCGSVDGITDFQASAGMTDSDFDSWDVVRNWAEKLLNIKVDNINDLATRIKGTSTGGLTMTHNSHVTARGGPKKYAPREPKEKRMLADIGPLKKRRKKKRKGSTSSESSCSNQLTQAQEASSSQEATAYRQVAATIDDDQSVQLVKVKQEITDSPIIQQQPQQQAGTAGRASALSNALCPDNYIPVAVPVGSQHQQMPMNLAKLPPQNHNAMSAAARATGAVRNLTPKIMELTTPSLDQIQGAVQGVSGAEHTPPAHQQPSSPTAIIIKNEVEESTPSHIYCKKVLKAQQIKGFWANSPSGGSVTGNSTGLHVPPIITTTAATPPPPALIGNDGGGSPLPQCTQLSMGPPAQMSQNATSVSPSGSLEPVPKVASRNMILLRAKRLMAAENANAAAAAAAGTSDDTSLPEALGLPRERVISICNMDKHELDDYFLPGEDENSEGPDTELLQYFQMGDAEEKQTNSLDAAEQNRNPQVTPTTNTASISSATGATASMTTAAAARGNHQQTMLTSTQLASYVKTMQQQHQQQLIARRAGNMPSPGTAMLPSANANANNIVGSASASLALMSRKHQQQQQQQHQHQQQQHQNQQRQKQVPPATMTRHMVNNNNNNNNSSSNNNNNHNRRKISLSNASNHGNNKNCIFLPISPNINSTGSATTSTTVGPTTTTTTTSSTPTASSSSTSTSSNCFASPGVSRMRLRSNLLTKQQSLDFDASDNADGNGDPMIGAHRRKRNYVYSYPTSTSASAPPSPSVLQQCMGANWSFSGNLNLNPNDANNDSSSTARRTTYADSNVALLADQNSMDLETSLALASVSGIDDFQLAPMSETQRSQSVPLSQLQRAASPTFNRQLNNASFQPMSSLCLSYMGEGTNIYSESSNSQQSVSTLKLNDIGNVGSTTGLLYDVDVGPLISPSFTSKFSSIEQQDNQQLATTCSSSTGSSSGYSSGGGSGSGGGGGGGGCSSSIVSRSVPSTPLPHHQLNFSSNGNSGNVGTNTSNSLFNVSPSFSWGTNVPYGGQSYGSGSGGGGGGGGGGTRNAMDISKSMPTTPITTPSFRYSPELHRDFFINGNTIDSITSSAFGGAGNDSLGVGALSSDTLIDDSVPSTSTVDAMIDAADILDNL